MLVPKAFWVVVGLGGGEGPVLVDHSGLTWMTLTSVESPVLEVTSRWRKSSLVMMKTMEEELKVTFFLGRFLPLHAWDMTIGRMGRSTGARGRSLRLRCSQESREQSSCSRQRRNWEREERRAQYLSHPHSLVCQTSEDAAKLRLARVTVKSYMHNQHDEARWTRSITGCRFCSNSVWVRSIIRILPVNILETGEAKENITPDWDAIDLSYLSILNCAFTSSQWRGNKQTFLLMNT